MIIDINGVIVNDDEKEIYDWIGFTTTCPKDVKSQIRDAPNDEVINVNINSDGGSLFAGVEIYSELIACKNPVEIYVTGYACSAASIIAMAGHSKISASAMLMIHNVQGRGQGDYRDLEKAADTLEKMNKCVMAAYREKTGKPEEELLEMMDKETWMTADEAVEGGFIDELQKSKAKRVNVRNISASGGSLLPAEVVNKIKQSINSQKQETISRTKYNLLKLKLKEI